LIASSEDEALDKELEWVKTILRQVYEATNEACLFLETAATFGRNPHARIEVVPVPSDALDEAALMFRESLQDVNGLFSQHGRIIDLTKERPLSRAVPARFTYLACEYSRTQNGSNRIGLAHVVDEGVSSSDIHTFLLDVVAGLLDEEPIARRPKHVRQDPAVEKRAIASVRQAWDRVFFSSSSPSSFIA
jgi:hypothetical protein